MRITRACMCLPPEGTQSTIRRKRAAMVAMSSAAVGLLCGLSGNSFEINFELIYINDLKFFFTIQK